MTSIETAVNVLDDFQPASAPVADGFVREERPSDLFAREALLDAALGPGRRLKTCEKLRAGRLPAEGLALVAVDGDSLVGSIRLWSVRAGGRPALLLGPLGVAAERRSQGFGARLIAEALFRAMRAGHGAVLLVGDAPYYNRFGFERRLAQGLTMPGPVELDRFLGLELRPGALAGAAGPVAASGVLASRPFRGAEARADLRAA